MFKKFKGKRRSDLDGRIFMLDGATTLNRNWGYPVPGKGGPTQNAILTPKMFEKELEMFKKEPFPIEHERYLGQMDVI